MTAEASAMEPTTQDQEYQARVDAAWLLFLKKYKDRIDMWMQNHQPHQKLPIEFDGRSFKWANRKARRK